MLLYNSKQHDLQHDLQQDTSKKCYPASLALAPTMRSLRLNPKPYKIKSLQQASSKIIK